MSWGVFPDGRTGLSSLLDPPLESCSLCQSPNYLQLTVSHLDCPSWPWTPTSLSLCVSRFYIQAVSRSVHRWVPGVKLPRIEADHSTPFSAHVNVWSYTSTPQYVFMVWYLAKHRDNFTCTCCLPLAEELCLMAWGNFIFHFVQYLQQKSWKKRHAWRS
jgi:hypothetical protein